MLVWTLRIWQRSRKARIWCRRGRQVIGNDFNKSVEPTGGSRNAETAFLSHWRLPPVAHAGR